MAHIILKWLWCSDNLFSWTVSFWENLTTKDIQELESVDTELLRRILEAPVSTPTCMLFLELGCIPLKYAVMQRRQMFLHYVLQQKPDSLLLKCLNVQIKHLDKWDWVNQIYSDLQELKIILTFEQIRLHPKEKFRSLVHKAIFQAALCWLNKNFFGDNEKDKRSKVCNVKHESL